MNTQPFVILQKPPFASPCNRCGVCCRMTPCQGANVVIGQYHGRCIILEESPDGITSCGLVTHPERWGLNGANTAAALKALDPNIPEDASIPDTLRHYLGDGSCDMVMRSDDGPDVDIPYGADLASIKAERVALWRPRG